MYEARGLKVPEVQGTFCAGFFFLPGSFTHAERCPCVASAAGDLSFPELESTCKGKYMAARQSSSQSFPTLCLQNSTHHPFRLLVGALGRSVGEKTISEECGLIIYGLGLGV